jgi:hypothetical protein
MKITVEQLQHILDTRDSGVLSHGAHSADDGSYCALEAVSLVRGSLTGNESYFTDDPADLGMPDIRPLNDAPWSSDEARTKAMLPLIAVLSDWSLWPHARKRKFATVVALETVRQIVSELPYIPDVIKEACRSADLKTAADAARAAWAAADAARAAAGAAATAAEADDILNKAISIWLKAASDV